MKNRNNTIILLAVVAIINAASVSSIWSKQTSSEPAGGKMSFLDNGTIRLGINLNLGGSITYLADSTDRINTINNHDWGRQIQMSFYSGPQPFTPGGKQPSKTWAGLGWNPIQSGDYAGNRSSIVEHRNDGKSIYVKCVPMQWPLDNEPGECTFESWIKLEGNVVKVRSRINNNRTDTTQYPGRGQELPAVYTNGPWYRLFSYTGDKPFTNGKLSRFTKTWTNLKDVEGSPWEYWTATENWAALVNENDWGLGVFKPDTYSFIGGFFGTPGKGTSKDGPTGYISPIRDEILDHNIEYEYEYELIVGKLDEIRRYVYKHSQYKSLPDYRFEKDRQHWVYRNTIDTGWPIRGELNISLDKNDPQLIGPGGFWQASDVPKIYIRSACRTQDTGARLFWRTHSEPGFVEQRSVSFETRPDGRYHTYEIDLSLSPHYKGEITGLRLDPVSTGNKGDYIKIEYISWRKPPELYGRIPIN
ncbi:MAG: hypothetical protein ACYSUX_02905 [Planctomycetota bacterium]|jgi:hypothetical protein